MTHRSYVMLSAIMLTTLACGSGVPIGSTNSVPADTTSQPPISPPATDSLDSPEICSLPVMLRLNHGAVVGVVKAMEGPNVGLPFDSPDREYWLVELRVDEVVSGTFDKAIEVAGNPLPKVAVDEPLTFVLYPDLAGTPVVPLEELFTSGEPVMVMMQGGGNPDDPTEQGRWIAIRNASVAGRIVNFHGVCSKELKSGLDAVAAVLNRQSNLDFLIEFQAEVLAHYADWNDKGPIEQTAYGSNGS